MFSCDGDAIPILLLTMDRPLLTELNSRSRDSTTELRDNSVEDSAQGEQGDRAENSLSQNIPGDGFVLKMAIENFVSEQESVNADNKYNQGSRHGD